MRLYNFIGGEISNQSHFHRHPDYEFHYIIEGNGVFKINDQSLHVKPGSFLICPPKFKHFFRSKTGLRQLIFFTHSNAFDNWPQLKHKLNNEIFNIELDLSFKTEYELIKRDSLSNIPDKQYGAFYSILGILLRRYNSVGSSRPSLVISLQQQLEKSSRNDNPIYKIAEDLNVSHVHLINLFKKETGMTPKKYQQKFRIDQSCYYLLTTEYSITKISEKVGFEDPLYFSRIFKKIMGINPRAWRSNSLA